MTALWPPSIDAPRAAINRLRGKTVNSVRRRGKALVLDLDGGLHVLLHPVMTGQLVVVDHAVTVFAGGHPSRGMLATMPEVTTRVVFGLSEDTVVYFNDQRKFGWIRILDTETLLTDPFLARLGPEPLDAQFTLEGFRARLAVHPRAPIKAVLLDQATVAGLGNIYVDESLHRAHIHPRRPAGTLTGRESSVLHEAVRATLSAAVDDGGTSFAAYVNAFRGRDDHLASASVFRRVGQPCPRCGTRIERIHVAERGTNFCPQCQQ